MLFDLHPEIKKKNAVAAKAKANATMLELCRLSQAVFINNEEGKKLLDLLKEIMILNSETANPKLDASYAYYNEGRNSVIRMLSDCAEVYPDLLRSEQMRSVEDTEKKENKSVNIFSD
jgi:regulator of sirC expression with transglutaminase-like and TPR domain